MEDKCFCHLNGYRVKDAEARARIEALEQNTGEAGGGVKGVYHLDLPLGLIIPGSNESYENILSDECKGLLTTFFNEKILVDNPETPILIINNTTESVEIEGEVITDISPKSLILTFSGKDDGIISFRGREERFLSSQKEESCQEYILSIIYTLADSYTITKASISSAVYELPTQKGIEETLANIGGGGVNESGIFVVETTTNFNLSTKELSDTYTRFAEIFTPYINDGKRVPAIKLVNSELGSGKIIDTAIFECQSATTTFPKSYVYRSCIRTNSDGLFNNCTLKIVFSDNGDGTYTCTSAKYERTGYKMYLATDNTDTYTPSSNYHPATKKYVDERITYIHSQVPMYNVTSIDCANLGGNELNSSQLSVISGVLTQMKKDNVSNGVLHICSHRSVLLTEESGTNIQNSPTSLVYSGLNISGNNVIYTYKLQLTLSWSGNTANVSDGTITTMMGSLDVSGSYPG